MFILSGVEELPLLQDLINLLSFALNKKFRDLYIYID